MLRDRINGGTFTVLALTLVATATSVPVTTTPALAVTSGDCETQARRRCIKHWPQNFPQYATFEDCVEGEVALGNCFMRTTDFQPDADRRRLPHDGDRRAT